MSLNVQSYRGTNASTDQSHFLNGLNLISCDSPEWTNTKTTLKQFIPNAYEPLTQAWHALTHSILWTTYNNIYPYDTPHFVLLSYIDTNVWRWYSSAHDQIIMDSIIILLSIRQTLNLGHIYSIPLSVYMSRLMVSSATHSFMYSNLMCLVGWNLCLVSRLLYVFL